MIKLKKIRISAINIVTHPHTSQKYINLLKTTFKMRRRISVHGSDYLMIGELRHHGADTKRVLEGRFYRFVYIDPTKPWVNTQTNDFATEEDMEAVNLPKELLPGSAMFNFVFYANTHTLYFERDSNGKSVSGIQVQKFFDKVFSDPKITEEFGEVNVTIVPAQDSLTRILKMHTLRELTIDVKKPNPDNIGSLTATVMGRLERMKARREIKIITAEKGESLEPDQDTLTQAQVAARNGKVTGVGYNAQGLRLVESTDKYPWEIAHEYAEKQQTPMLALVSATENIGDVI